MLSVAGLEAGYGTAQVLFGVDLEVGAGAVVTLLGRNGMGKTTLIGAIMGLIRPWAGRAAVDGVDLARAPPYRIAQAGLGLVPEGRQIFPTLTTEENLVATASGLGSRGRWSASTRCCRASRSAAISAGGCSPAASSRCWRSAAR
jgi:branched-chain amino acid transport system ATP-binding protein